jgi:alginate O-acetyltransferase complex protein AlgI
VTALVFYKYTRFLCLSVVGAAWPDAGQEFFLYTTPLLPLAPPLAISFFVFEFVHYLSDVLRGKPSIREPMEFCLFSLFWPSIVAGPVKRYEQFLPELQRGITDLRKRDVAAGLVLVALGLVKKFAADTLTAYVSCHDKEFCSAPPAMRWTIFIAIGLRILCDFSGYSDMAIGFALMFGVRLPRNFNWPYLALSITDFWNRWHISLSQWIRDYVYIPIGGGRCGASRKIVNGLTAFALCGLWHGAAWNFLFWGVYHGVGLAVSSNYAKLGGRPGRLLAAWLDCNRIVSRALTLLFVNIGWLFFFYPLPSAFRMIRALVRF